MLQSLPTQDVSSAEVLRPEPEAPWTAPRRGWHLGRVLLLIGPLLLGMALFFTGYLWLTRSSSSQLRLTAEEPSPTRPVVALGRLEPEGGIVCVGGPMGDRIACLAVQEGQTVEKGQELARVESYREREAERDLARSQLEEAKARRVALQVSSDHLVRQAELNLEQFQNESHSSLQVQETRVRTLQEQWNTADKELKRLKQKASEIVSPQELSLQELAFRQAEGELAAGRIMLDNLRTNRDLGLKAATTRLQTAKAERDRLLQEVPIQSLKNSLALAQVRLDRTIVRAPCSGKVLKVPMRAGETIGAGPLLLLADLSRMLAVAEVYETDRRHLQENLPATVTSQALPRPLTGTVISIGRLVAANRVLDLNPTADADRRIVEVKVRLDEGPDTVAAAVFLNLQVTVTIGRSLGGTTPAGLPGR